jgi:hypothetical protein
MSYAETKDGTIILSLNRDDYELLLLILGFATGAAWAQDIDHFANSFIALSNRLNEGNPNFRPYVYRVRKADS